jgi:phospho-N-acetylmuramoyl-pentapeptide-transferase
MLYALLYPLHTTFSGFNVLRYISFRAVMAALTAFVVSFLFGPWLIRKLTAAKIGQHIRPDGPERHLTKAGTPTMGGVLILSSLLLATLLLADLTNQFVWLVLAVTGGFAAIGFVDDWRKLTGHNSKGLPGKTRLRWEFAIGLAAGAFLYTVPHFDTALYFPFLKHLHVELGLLYIPFAAVLLVGAANAVNLTDGLDGLAIGPVMTTAFTYGIFAYATGNARLAEYLQVPYITGTGELAIFCSALVCAGLGFLWFNAYPAMMFMGDVGALPLGAALGILALLTKQELVLVIAGGVFVVEALSVILQVASFKLRRKRIFRMAPIHHHFELLGWPEPQIIVRAWILSILCAVLALSTLKLR